MAVDLQTTKLFAGGSPSSMQTMMGKPAQTYPGNNQSPSGMTTQSQGLISGAQQPSPLQGSYLPSSQWSQEGQARLADLNQRASVYGPTNMPTTQQQWALTNEGQALTQQYGAQPGQQSALPAANQQGPTPTQGTNPIAQAQYQTIDPILRQVQDNELSRNQLNSMLADESPLLQRARARAAAAMNSRGLLNSSTAVGASEGAAWDAAAPFALQDAQTYTNAARDNQEFGNRGLEFNADAFNRNQETNTGYINRRGDINVQEEGADRRLGVQEAGQDRRLAVTEKGLGERQQVTESGLNRRLEVTEKGQMDRLNIAEKGSMDRLQVAEAGENRRTDVREAGATARQQSANQTQIQVTGMNNATQLSAANIAADTQRYTANLSSNTQREVAQLGASNAAFLQSNALASGAWQNALARIDGINANENYDQATRDRLAQNELNGAQQAIDLARGAGNINLAAKR
jgi:hypothetical protein